MKKFDRFCEVTSEIHRLIGVEPKCPIGSEDTQWITDFEIDDVALAIMYSESDDPDALRIVCVFGELSEISRPDILNHLMRLNFSLSTKGTSSFCLDPVSSKIMFIARVEFEKMNRQTILNMLVDLAEQAKQWRQTQLVDCGIMNSVDMTAIHASSLRV